MFLNRQTKDINERDTVYVNINGLHFKVVKHWFWKQFRIEAWEPSTYRLMNKYLRNDKTYIDIGTWIGPTIMYAVEIGVDNIRGIEANPITYNMLNETSKMNKLISNKLILYNICITDKDNALVDFGGKRGADTSSASSIRGNKWKIPSSTIFNWIEQNNISNYNFIKIDIEGAEKYIENDLIKLSATQELVILLSLHPPFWDDKISVAQKLLNGCSHYQIFDINENPLTLDQLNEMVLTKIPNPGWGTKHGNFFEILLKSK